MTDSAVAEGHVKLRDGKKWKSRWVVLRKPSPVADCLVLVVSKDRGAKEKNSVVVEHICGLETGHSSEGVSYTLTILSLNQSVQLGFDSKEGLLAWDFRLRYYLGEVHSFKVTVLPGTKLESGPATLHLCNNLLVIARDSPPVINGQWNLLDLRRYGPVHSGFVFEGGTRCGYWTGVFFLSCAEGEQISFLFDCIVRGISPSRGPFGLKPLLPEPCVSAASVEEKLNQEAEELEKRLSLLSHSTASTTSFGSSAAGDDRSISGSSEHSETTRSDSSMGSRMALWAEPAPTSAVEPMRAASHEDEKLIIGSASGPRVPSKPARSRRLQEIGRQGSSDSGIATGSHSSYSGSFSSYTGSLDAGSPREEYGALLSLPPPSSPEKHPCTCPVSHTHEYQVPSSLRYLYDTPRSLLEARAQKEAATTEQTERTVIEPTETSASALSIPESARDTGTPGSPSTDTQSECLVCSPNPSAARTLFTTCHICGGLKRAPFPQSGATLQHGLPGVASAGGKSDRLITDPSAPATNREQDLQIDSSAASTLNSCSTQSLSFSGSEISEKPESYIDSLSDLLGHYGSGKTDTVTIKPSLPDLVVYYPPPGTNNLVPVRTGPYVPMSSALASPHCPESCQGGPAVPSRHTSRSPIYENCLQCRKGQDGCMLPKTVPPVIRGSLIHPAEMKISEGHDLSTCSWISRWSEIQPDKESHPTSLPPLVLNSGETSEGDKKQRSHMDRGRMDPAYEIMEGQAADRSSESDEKRRYESMSSCGQQRSADDTEDCSGLSDKPKGGVTYVNIPISPTSKKQLHYMELELQEHSTTVRGKGTTKYAQIDIVATETAHRVGSQHALGREAGLQRLEQWRKGGAPQ